MKYLKMFLLILLFVLPAMVVSAGGPSSLNGKWKLNKKESDDPRAKFAKAWKDQERSQQRGEQRRERPPESMEPGVRAKQERPLGLLSDVDEFAITSTDAEAKIVDSSGKEKTLYLDGRKSEFAADHDRTIGFLARWEGDALIIDSLANRAGDVSETLYLSADAKQLYVKMRMQPLMLENPVTVIRVYDAVGK